MLPGSVLFKVLQLLRWLLESKLRERMPLDKLNPAVGNLFLSPSLSFLDSFLTRNTTSIPHAERVIGK